MDTKEMYIDTLVYGTDKKLYQKLEKEVGKAEATVLAITEILVKYEDKTADIIDLTNVDEAKRREAIQKINKAAKSKEIRAKKYHNYYTEDPRYIEMKKSIEKLLSKNEEKKEKKNSLKALLLAGGIGLGAVALGSAGVATYAHLTNPKTIEHNIDDDNESDLTNEQLANSIVVNQNNVKASMRNWLVAENGNESWQRETLTKELMEKYGYTEAEAIYGFTAEEAYSLALRFGNYSKDEYVKITGGNLIDTTMVMNDSYSMSNGAMSTIIGYYVNSPECDLNIENIINFNDKEVSKIREFEELFKEYHVLELEEGKEKEAEAKMKEIKDKLVEYANSIDSEQVNAKSYILRTFVPAASIISVKYDYKDTIVLNLYDIKEDEQIQKEVKTDMFDELSMRTLVYGFDGENNSAGEFVEKEFLEQHDISSKKYQLLATETGMSIADSSCSSQIAKLEEVNEYINSLSEDKFAELTEDTVAPEVMFEEINKELKAANKYPKNISWFSQAKITEAEIEYKDTHGVTSGNVGDYVKDEEKHEEQVTVTESQMTTGNSYAQDENGNKQDINEAIKEAEEKARQEEELKKQQEAEQAAKERQVMLQGVYDATYNYYAGETRRQTSYSYNGGWASSSDAAVVSQYNKGMSDGLAYKNAKAQAGVTTGGQTNIDEQYKNAETTATPQAPTQTPSTDEGYTSNEAPTDFAPVVSNTQITEAEIDTYIASLSSEEWNAFVDEVKTI